VTILDVLEDERGAEQDEGADAGSPRYYFPRLAVSDENIMKEQQLNPSPSTMAGC
jgi:hypothetical protein